MPRLTLLPLAKTIDVKPGTTVLEAIRQAGFEIAAACNGQGRCGKCKIRLVEAPADEQTDPSELLSAEEWASGVRLACQVTVDRTMQVVLIGPYTQDARIVEGERIAVGGIAPAVSIATANGMHTLCYLGRPPVPLPNWKKACSPKGLAVDLGTTNMVIGSMDLKSGKEVATAAALNPQTRYGHDVMTRIQMASSEKGLKTLSLLVSDRLNELIDKVCQDAGHRSADIVDVVLGGNPTMLQIAAAIDPSPLGRVPFEVGIQGGRSHAVARFRLRTNPQARVYVPPIAHAFIGSDISAGLLSVDFFEKKKPSLFIDIGTNGEMALIAKDVCWVTSMAAGPAFEGMGISHGMRASPGAIEMVWFDADHLGIRTIANAPGIGLCGSGIIDTVAALLRSEAMDSGGRLKNPQQETVRPSPLRDRYTIVDGMPCVQLTDGVRFTQKDIRAFQLAKSAIRTGIEMLVCRADTTLDQLETILIAGAFGHHLKPESLRLTGIVPTQFEGNLQFVGNTSRTGCALMLMNASLREYLEERMRRVKHLVLAGKAEFQSRFIKNLSF